MGLQVSTKGEVRIDGRKPRGLRERLWAWLTLWQVNRAIRAAVRDKGMSESQKRTRDLKEKSRSVRSSLLRHYVLVACAVILVPLCLFEAWSTRVEPAWKPIAWALGSLVWACKARSDYRALLERKKQKDELLVDEVHDL